MKVRVQKDKVGFIYGILRRGDNPDKDPDEFTLKSFKHYTKKGENGKPLVISVKDQFSEEWMEKR